MTSHQTLTDEQIASYQELGYLGSIPVLSEDEVKKYRDAIDKTSEALGGNVTRLDGTHRFFRWVWTWLCNRYWWANCSSC